MRDGGARVALGAADLGPSWVWPYWLDRQLDPESPAHAPDAGLHALANVNSRNWTTVGNLDSPWSAIVDQRGLVSPGGRDGWSLDWWVGTGERWHFPSREVAVRQRLVDDAPVVETAMRVPGGDVVERVYAVRDGQADLVVVEVENLSPVPVTLAFAIRPWTAEAITSVERIELDGDTTVLVDDRVAVLLPRPPSRMAGSAANDGDVAAVVEAGADAGELAPVQDDGGMATAAFIFPLPHGTTLRIGLPLGRTVSRRSGRRAPARRPQLPASLPSAGQVANGWREHGNRGVRLELPDARLQSCVDANRRHLLVLHDDHLALRDARAVLGALDAYGYEAEVDQVLGGWPDLQRADGSLGRRRSWDANGRAIVAVAEHWRLHRDRELLDRLVPMVAQAAKRIERRRHRRIRRPGVAADGLLPGRRYVDDLWGVRGLLDAAEVLAAAGEATAAADALTHAGSYRTDLDRSLAATRDRLGIAAIPAAPAGHLDEGTVDGLAGCQPLRLFAADDERIADTAAVVRERFGDGPAVVRGAGRSPSATIQLGLVELACADHRALDRLAWALDVASPTWTWPGTVHRRLPGGTAGDGHDARVAADVLLLVRDLLVREVEDGLALLTLVPDDWLGQPLAVHDAPTRFGTISYAVRWHGDRPALLWELAPHPGLDAVRISAPGLDRWWSTTERSGEALLSPVAAPGTPVRLARRPPPSS